ncbi:MAG: cell division protein FtsA [Bacteroidetes bacterium]|nr:cell division protein FtsA [Bacteroidota bacterium]
MKEKIVVGLDIGTTKICAIVGKLDENGSINILGIGKAPSEGLNRGVVANIDKTVKSIQAAISDAQNASGMEIKSVTVGIAGDHIQSFHSRGVVTIANPDHEVTEKDVNRLLADTRKIALPSDRQIIHVIPQEFIIDGQDGVIDPVGMTGIRMEANVHIITGLVTAIRNIEKCVQKAGLQVDDIVLEPIASSMSVLSPEEKEVGVALLDIGGGTTDLAIFEDKTIRKTSVIALAGQKVTDDIRHGLGILQHQAEFLKVNYGITHISELVADEKLLIEGISGRPPKEVQRSTLCQIIQPRMEEILEIVRDEIQASGYGRKLSAGLVITGGGAMILGIATLARELTGLDVKIGIPTGLDGGLVREVENPMYATSVGLVIHGLTAGKASQIISRNGLNEIESSLETEEEKPEVTDKQKGTGKGAEIIDKMKNWFKDL